MVGDDSTLKLSLFLSVRARVCGWRLEGGSINNWVKISHGTSVKRSAVADGLTEYRR